MRFCSFYEEVLNVAVHHLQIDHFFVRFPQKWTDYYIPQIANKIIQNHATKHSSFSDLPNNILEGIIRSGFILLFNVMVVSLVE